MKNKETAYGFIRFSDDIKNLISKINMNTQTEKKRRIINKEG